MKMKTQWSKTLVCSASSSKREDHINTGLPPEGRKMSNKQPNLTTKVNRTRRTKKTQNKQK